MFSSRWTKVAKFKNHLFFHLTEKYVFNFYVSMANTINMHMLKSSQYLQSTINNLLLVKFLNICHEVVNQTASITELTKDIAIFIKWAFLVRFSFDFWRSNEFTYIWVFS